eukprot:31479-Pelagococcus_subviridis.AAC.26
MSRFVSAQRAVTPFDVSQRINGQSIARRLSTATLLPTNASKSLANHAISKTRCLRLDVHAQQSKGPPPMVMERFQSVATQLMNQRIIRLGGAVDDDSCNLIVAQLLWLDAADPNQDITIYVNSPGGSVTAGMAVFDTMRHVRPNVSTGKRYSLPNSRIMIHQPLGGAQGQAADIEIQANEIMVSFSVNFYSCRKLNRVSRHTTQHHKSTLNGYLAEFTDTDRDFFMSATEAKEYGLIDTVIEHPTDVAVRSSGIPLYAGEL